jgi:hypothetical protein
MCIELIVLVYVTFKRHSGLYFWSIIITTCGIALQTTGYILKEFKNDCPPILTTIICKLGWVANVSGFSIVLWSRLHLVVRDPRVLRLVLIMIIVDGILLHTPVVVFEFGLISRHHWEYVRPMEIMERIQQTIFTCQETIISSLYIYHTRRFLNSGYASHTRKVIGLLVAVQMLVICFDAGLTTFDYCNMFTLKVSPLPYLLWLDPLIDFQCTVHPFVYSVKLKLEFIVLNQLLTLVKRGMAPCNLPALAGDSKSSSETDSQKPAEAPAQEKHRRSFLPHSFRFSSKSAHSGTQSSIMEAQTPPFNSSMPSTKDVSAEADDVVVGSPEANRSNSDQTLHTDETDLIKVVGTPDEDPKEPAKVIDDIERQYLGRFGM